MSAYQTTRATLALLLLTLTVACGDDGDERGYRPPNPVDWSATFEALDGQSIAVGEQADCSAVRMPERPADLPADWTTIEVQPGGLAAALQEAGEQPAILLLGPGTYGGPVVAQSSLAVVGACADTTVIRQADTDVGISAEEIERLHVQGVHLEGGAVGVQAVAVQRVDVVSSVITDSGDAGIELSRVAEGTVRGSTVRGAGGGHVVVQSSRVALRDSAIGPGRGVGVLADRFGAAGPTCVEDESPACPYASLLFIDRSLIEQTSTRGIVARSTMLRISRTRVREVARTSGPAAGLDCQQSFAVVDQGSWFGPVDGIGLSLASCRSHVEGVRVSDAVDGGVAVVRLATDALAPFPRAVVPDAGHRFAGSDMFPSPLWYPGETWNDPPSFDGAEFEPPPDWYPGETWLPNPDEGELPYPLRPDTPNAELAPDLDLHLWARSDLRDVESMNNGVYGVRVTGHPAAMTGVMATGTTGSGSVGLWVDQNQSEAELMLPGSSLVAFSRIDEPVVTNNEGVGLLAARVGIMCRDAAETELNGAPCSTAGGGPQLYPAATTLRLSGGVVDDNTIGVALIEAATNVSGTTASNNRGIGLWAAGAIGRIADVTVSDTQPGPAPAGDGSVEIADGIVVQSSDYWYGSSTLASIALSNNAVAGSDRGAILLIRRDGEQLRGSIDRGDAAVSGSDFDVAIVGDLADQVATTGFDAGDIEVRDDLDVPEVPSP